MKLRFHLLPTALLAAFGIVLTGSLLFFATTRLNQLAQESALTVFSLIAQRNADQLHGLLSATGTTVQAQALLEPQQIRRDGQVNREVLVPALVAALRANPHIYSLYYGFGDGAFLQVIGVRADAHVESLLRAPAGTHFAVRFIEPIPPEGQAGQQESWQFLAGNEKSLASSVRGAQYIPNFRPWYDSALAAPGLHVTEPYEFESLQGLGLTVSRALTDRSGVFGADLALGNLESYAAASLEGREGGIVVADDQGRVLAAHATPRFGATTAQPLELVARSANPLFAEAAGMLRRDGGRISEIADGAFAYASRSVAITPDSTLHVVAFAPMSLYTGLVDETSTAVTGLALLILGLFLPLAYFAAQRMSGTFRRLTADAERIQRMDFSGDEPVRSSFLEIDLLGAAQHTARKAIRDRTEALDRALVSLERLVISGTQLASRRNRPTVLQQTLESARLLTDAHAGQFWLLGDDGTLRLAAQARGAEPGEPEQEMAISPAESPADPCAWVLRHSRALRLERTGDEFDLGKQRLLLGATPDCLLAVPVLARGAKVSGVLVLANTGGAAGAAAAFDPSLVRYAETLAAQAGIALENIELLESQRELMDAILQLIAGAIDAKSAYTGAHCARVPELARMLAEAASEANSGPLANFRFETEEQWREFRIGTWLHDCGKVTTPEYVVDKATKLETIYNRIHEIRTRFEVLLRDARIEHLNALLAGADPGDARRAYDEASARLQEEFAFVAHCNIGDESMPADSMQRLREIGARTWLRHFDDRLGLSHAERERLRGRPPEPLPAVERLLADRPEHVVPRTSHDRHDERYGFRMDVPENLYDFGELHNLCVSRGTLTDEERYKINEHIVQTIVMLDRLPLPPELGRVPEYAGTHHETLTGNGYPRKLTGEQLSVPARIMAIADIFEALTASDRPYKQAKPLSEAVRILAGFKARKHIDADLFDLFLSSGTYLRYAQAYLPPEQIDRVDVAQYLG